MEELNLFETKKCSKCGLVLPLEGFSKDSASKDKLRTECKHCESAQKREYYQKNKDKITEQRREYYRNNKTRVKARINKYKTHNRAKIHEQTRKYKRDYMRTRRQTDPLFRLQHNIRRAFSKFLKQTRTPKPGSTFSVLGYSPEELLTHLETTIPEGYSTADLHLLHIDHIIPMAAFAEGLASPEVIKECFALTNLRYLPAKDNVRKSDNIVYCCLETREERTD